MHTPYRSRPISIVPAFAFGSPARAIAAFVEEIRPDLLMIGRTHRRAWFRSSTLAAVVARAQCGVLVLPTEPQGRRDSAASRAR
jgi:nucleotide-binding universal stress UspA family protein